MMIAGSSFILAWAVRWRQFLNMERRDGAKVGHFLQARSGVPKPWVGNFRSNITSGKSGEGGRLHLANQLVCLKKENELLTGRVYCGTVPRNTSSRRSREFFWNLTCLHSTVSK